MQRMQPLNPFLAAFFKSPLPAQCAPVHHHILLVPATDVLLTSRDTESGAPFSELVASEDFLGSHVLRITNPINGAGGREPNLREMRGKAKQYNTVNGRSVVIKDSLVYSNKGFKTLSHASLLYDAVWYPDTLEPRPWLVYYISRPLVGAWEEVKITPVLLEPGASMLQRDDLNQPTVAPEEASDAASKKDIKTFDELLRNFPVISRQMQDGTTKLFADIAAAFEPQLPPPPSATHIPDPNRDAPFSQAMKQTILNTSQTKSSVSIFDGTSMAASPEMEEIEYRLRVALETGVNQAIELFQGVDKSQLSLLGSTTDLTGPRVEKLIERFVAENTHGALFPRLTTLRRRQDLELEAKIRQMENIDISQLGIPIEGNASGKRELTARLGRAVEEFRKMSNATSPQEMMDILLSTLKSVTELSQSSESDDRNGVAATEKSVLTVNADTLISLLLFVVIRAQIKHLHARLKYIRNFTFIDDIDTGEMGYALNTSEAVLSYLARDSAGLRRASRRNRHLWDTVEKGDLPELTKMMEPSEEEIEEDRREQAFSSRTSSRRASASDWSGLNGSSRRSSRSYSFSDRYSSGSGLSHVFPFQNQHDEMDEAPFEWRLPSPKKKKKRVSMDTRSMSSGSEISFRSRTTSVGSIATTMEGDTSVERLSQTQNTAGESIPMMAIQHRQPGALKYLLTLKQFYPPEFLREDRNNEGTTLLSAAVQLGHTELIDIILDFVIQASTDDQISEYFSIQDIWGRSVAHYLFHAPHLIQRFGRLLPWRQRDKNGQTPLFALCRSYDHGDYFEMVDAGLYAAQKAQKDGGPLHLDDHVDSKGNTLLHIINDADLAKKLLQHADADVNATNDKKFTALMVASKYGRLGMVRSLYADPRVDVAAKELRGLTAVELAKDDDIRNKIDDLCLFQMPKDKDGRMTGVVRSYFVEDATIRLVLKSGAPVPELAPNSYNITTSRRSLADFERLANLLAVESPASWIPNVAGQRSPFQIPSKPSRAVLRDIQTRMDWFLRLMLSHPTFSEHEMLWEFFLVPDLQAEMLEQRSKLKADLREEKVAEEFEPLEDVKEVEQFVDHARDMVRSVNYSTKSVARRVNTVGMKFQDIFDSTQILSRVVSTLSFLPESHIAAFDMYARNLSQQQSNPHAGFHSAFLALQSTVQALLASLGRPPALIHQIYAARRIVERNSTSLSRSTRWPLGLLDDTRQRLNEEKEEKMRRGREDLDHLARELRYTQQVVAGELAGWQDMHERIGRKAIKDFAREVVVQERMRLEGLRRALRKVRVVNTSANGTMFTASDQAAIGISSTPPYVPDAPPAETPSVGDQHDAKARKAEANLPLALEAATSKFVPLAEAFPTLAANPKPHEAPIADPSADNSTEAKITETEAAEGRGSGEVQQAPDPVHNDGHDAGSADEIDSVG